MIQEYAEFYLTFGALLAFVTVGWNLFDSRG